MPTPDLAPSELRRADLLDAVLPHVPFDGWTKKALEHAREDLGWTHDEMRFAAPNGATELIDALFDRADQAIRDRFAEMNLGETRIRDQVARGVMAWFEVLDPHKEAVRKAGARIGVHPEDISKPGERIWKTADLIWSEMGQPVKGLNDYSKRTVLSAVLSSTMLAWFSSYSLDEVEAFLARRVENVMAIEKFKAKIFGQFQKDDPTPGAV